MIRHPPVLCWTDCPLWLSVFSTDHRIANLLRPWPTGEPKIYQVELVSYDGNKHVVVRHEKYGLVEFKAGYLFPNKQVTKPGKIMGKYKRYIDRIPQRTLNKPRFLHAIPFDDREKLGVVGI